MAISLRELLGDEMPVSWDPRTDTVKIGGTSFQSSQIPGTQLIGGQHMVTDETALRNALGGGPLQTPTGQRIEDVISQVQNSMSTQTTPTLEEILQMVSNLPQYETPSVLSYEDAQSRAAAQLDPRYRNLMDNTLRAVGNDLTRRGFFGQAPGAAITADAAARVGAEQVAAIAQMAQQMVEQSEASAREMEALNLQRKGQDIQSLMQALGLVQSGEQQKMSSLFSLLNALSTLDQNQFSQLMEREKLGISKQDLDLRREAQNIEAALARTQATGRVSEADAPILGVPAGASFAAAEAEKERQLRLRIAQMQQSSNLAAAGQENLLNELRRIELEKLRKEMGEEQALMEGSRAIQAQFGTDLTTAEAIYSLWENPTRDAALADLKANQKELQQIGVDIKMLKTSIDTKWPLPKGSQSTYSPPRLPASEPMTWEVLKGIF